MLLKRGPLCHLKPRQEAQRALRRPLPKAQGTAVSCRVGRRQEAWTELGHRLGVHTQVLRAIQGNGGAGVRKEGGAGAGNQGKHQGQGWLSPATMFKEWESSESRHFVKKISFSSRKRTGLTASPRVHIILIFRLRVCGGLSPCSSPGHCKCEGRLGSSEPE